MRTKGNISPGHSLWFIFLLPHRILHTSVIQGGCDWPLFPFSLQTCHTAASAASVKTQPRSPPAWFPVVSGEPRVYTLKSQQYLRHLALCPLAAYHCASQMSSQLKPHFSDPGSCHLSCPGKPLLFLWPQKFIFSSGPLSVSQAVSFLVC